MPTPLPYLPSYKNIDKLFAGISTAKVPDTFGQKFLSDTLGIKGTGDRPLIPFLRVLGFLDGANKPTNAYAHLKNPALKSRAIAQAIKVAYAPLFDADENANNRSAEDLRGLVSQVSGADSGTLGKIMGTLNGIMKLADFSILKDSSNNEEEEEEVEEDAPPPAGRKQPPKFTGSNNAAMPFHFNIQVHLPSNSTEEVYLNIFNAIRKVFN